MLFPEKEIELKDGRTCLLRPALPEDAAAMTEYMKVTAGESPFLLRYPDEVDTDEARERAFLTRMRDDPRAVMAVAEVEGNVAGAAAVAGYGVKRKLRHRCEYSVALYRAYHRLGLGAAVTAYLTELARGMGYGQMDLQVFADNAPALALYRRCGFVESGRVHNAVRLDDGTYRDLILMYKPLD